MAAAEVTRENTLNINLGILGHVDSGKTSLARALSTMFSTASLDRSPQSQERGITLDLGFSGFFLPVPEHLKGNGYEQVQITLVDCPGHASLIRTIIGGAQIIDMMVLVIDVTKGFQTQTAEGLVIGEITTDNMVVVLNKIDLLPEAERQKRIDKTAARIAKTLETSRFAGAPIVALAANPGAEGELQKPLEAGASNPPMKIDEFLNVLSSRLKAPVRNTEGPFLFAIDHCFQIKGQGTIMTGTVLSGKVRVNDMVELPMLQTSKKVKSMQMFRKPVQVAMQGDRVGICVTQLDAKSIERGVAASPGTVHTALTCAVASVERIKYFKRDITSRSKYHVTLGHTTVMATVHFFGDERPSDVGPSSAAADATSTAPAAVDAGAPVGPGEGFLGVKEFDFSREYLNQEELFPNSHTDSAGVVTVRPRGTQYVLLEFEKPVVCAKNCVIIGSKLDVDIKSEREKGLCRLAFHGRLLDPVDPAHKEVLRVYTVKEKEGSFFRINDEYNVICKDLFSKETPVAIYQGLKVESSTGGVGIIEGSFGSGNKFKVHFREGGQTDKKATIKLRYKRYVFDSSRKLVQ